MDELFYDKRIAGLIIKYLQEEITEAEHQELQAWVGSSERAREIFDELTLGEKLPGEVTHFAESRKRVLAKIHEAEPETRVVVELSRGFRWRPWLAAAVVVIVSAVTIFYLRPSIEKDIAKTENGSIRYKNDIPPGGNKATLTLADGTVITLDSVGRGELTRQGNILVNNTAGEINYVSVNPGVNIAVQYNKVVTEKQGQYKLTLSDGTQVWLNAESSIYFPTEFLGDKRVVEITGEVFFDVSTNKQMPFIVKYKNMSVEVTGTAFNVSTYENEESINTTLVEGSIKVLNRNNLLNLIPGEQAQLTRNGELKLNKTVKVDEAIAWKDGKFEFSNADIKTIMRQLERWYDIQVVYETDLNVRFNATKVSRYLPISELLKLFELTEQIRFKIDGKKVVVMK